MQVENKYGIFSKNLSTNSEDVELDEAK